MERSRLMLVDTSAPESAAERARRLQAEAKAAAREHLELLEKALVEMKELALEIAQGGEAYPAGVRDLCRRLGEDAEWRSQTLESIMQKSA